MRAITFLTVLITGLLTLIFYVTVNYLLFQDFGFVPAGRIVFASKYGYIDYLILPIGILIGMYTYKKVSNGTTFKKLFRFGLQTTIKASILFSAFIFIYLQFIEPDYFYKLIDLIKQVDIPGKELSSFEKEMLISAKSIEETELFRSPLFYTTANFLVYFLLGTLSSFLFATLLNKLKPDLNYIQTE